jgi:hypothetical protein
MGEGSRYVDLCTCTEDDVVEIFRIGLSAFVERAGGTFRSRRVTLREERSYPSDQDYALVFTSPDGFRLHLFGLQFKRWNKRGWSIDSRQVAILNRLAHVIGYCLPRPCVTAPSNSLHGFYFVNASCLPAECATVRLLHSLGGEHGSHEDDNWAHLRLLAEPRRNGASENIPRLAWGEFLAAVERGATLIPVPGGPNDPPGPSTEPRQQDFAAGTGIGLTITCPGAWGSAWARHQITDHVRYWTRTALSPPAAVIAFESFSRSIDFVEVAP